MVTRLALSILAAVVARVLLSEVMILAPLPLLLPAMYAALWGPVVVGVGVFLWLKRRDTPVSLRR